MTTVTVSSHYRIVIPKEVRARTGIKPGQTFQFIEYGDRIELVPMRDMKSMRGFAPGTTTSVNRRQDSE
jgi:AbrB family looped-hinge helix DNA binding protein